MTVNHLATGSNPVFGATSFKPHKIGTSSDFLQPNCKNYDTFLKKKDTSHLRLYKVDTTYYYRRRIKQKLIRISLKTKNIKEALKRKKVLDLLNGEEMFKLETADFKLMFEYDTEEELKTALEHAMQMQIEAKVQRFKEVKNHISNAENMALHGALTFSTLRDRYIAHKTQVGKVGADSITAYNATFNMLIDFFKDKDINSLKVEDFEAFQHHIKHVTKRKITNLTVNKHINYLKQFLEHALKREYIAINRAKAVESLDETADARARKRTVFNYTNEQVHSILNHNYNEPRFNVRTIFLIALYSGMRQADIYNLTRDNIKQDKNNIYYFDIEDAKSLAGIREVPIHENILDDVLAFDFSSLKNIDIKYFSKRCRLNLYNVITQGDGYNFHTFRGTFIEKILETNDREEKILSITQEIVGHAKEDKVRLTRDVYGKKFALSLKKGIVNSVSYQ